MYIAIRSNFKFRLKSKATANYIAGFCNSHLDRRKKYVYMRLQKEIELLFFLKE